MRAWPGLPDSGLLCPVKLTSVQSAATSTGPAAVGASFAKEDGGTLEAPESDFWCPGRGLRRKACGEGGGGGRRSKAGWLGDMSPSTGPETWVTSRPSPQVQKNQRGQGVNKSTLPARAWAERGSPCPQRAWWGTGRGHSGAGAEAMEVLVGPFEVPEDKPAAPVPHQVRARDHGVLSRVAGWEALGRGSCR